MSKKIYIYSTLTNDRIYGDWKKGASDLPIKGEQVFIKGGANVVTRHLDTPRGVMTRVTEEQLAVMQKDPAFLRHVQRGFIKVEEVEAVVEKVVSDMETRDASAPLTPGDYLAKDQEPPKVAETVKAPAAHPARNAPKPPKK